MQTTETDNLLATDQQIVAQARVIAEQAQAIADELITALSDGTLHDPRHVAAKRLLRNAETLVAWTARR